MSVPSVDMSLEKADDQHLIELIGSEKSQPALRELYDRYRHTLGGFLRTKVREDQLVDEIFNDVMLTVWRKAEGFRGDSKVSTWIFGIAYRICLAEYRKQERLPSSTSEYDLDQMHDAASMTHESEQVDQLDRLKAELVNLPENHREVIELMYFCGHSLAEVSELTDCPVNTVKTRLFHARKKLITRLRPRAKSAIN